MRWLLNKPYRQFSRIATAPVVDPMACGDAHWLATSSLSIAFPVYGLTP